MRTSIKQSGKASSVPGALTISAAVSILITLAASLLIANFLNSEKITWEQAGYWIMGMLFTASFIGGKSAIMATKRQKILISIMSGILYWGLLLCMTALFFGGDFNSVWETAGIVLAGCGSAALLTVPAGKKNRKKVRGCYR